MTATTRRRGGTILTVTIPGCPDAALSPNSRVHPLARHRVAAAAKRDAALATSAERWGLGDDFEAFIWPARMTLNVTVRWAKGRKTMDSDNLWAALKPYRDGIARTMRLDDKRFDCGELVQERDPSGVGEVIVRLEVG